MPVLVPVRHVRQLQLGGSVTIILLDTTEEFPTVSHDSHANTETQHFVVLPCSTLLYQSICDVKCYWLNKSNRVRIPVWGESETMIEKMPRVSADKCSTIVHHWLRTYLGTPRATSTYHEGVCRNRTFYIPNDLTRALCAASLKIDSGADLRTHYVHLGQNSIHYPPRRLMTAIFPFNSCHILLMEVAIAEQSCTQCEVTFTTNWRHFARSELNNSLRHHVLSDLITGSTYLSTLFSHRADELT